MRTNFARFLTITAVVAVVSAICLLSDAAEPKPSKLPRSHVEAVNLTNMTFTVIVKETNLTVQVTSETRFYLHGKPAVFKDLEAADHVSGTIRGQTQGPTIAIRVRIDKLAPK